MRRLLIPILCLWTASALFAQTAEEKQIEAAKELHEKKKKKKGWFWGGSKEIEEKKSPPPSPKGASPIQEKEGLKRSKSGKPLREMTGSAVPGIYPVYEEGKRWLVLDRPRKDGKLTSPLMPGTQMILIGSEGVAPFYAQRSTVTTTAACENKLPKPLEGHLLSAKSAASFKTVGTPIIALLLPKGRELELDKVRFEKLKSRTDEGVYKEIESTLKNAALEDLRSGAFQEGLDDPGFAKAESELDPASVQLKIDFAARIRYRGLDAPLISVDSAIISKTTRRCLRLFTAGALLGSCVELPHELLAETGDLEFVAYDPSGAGTPFILAHTARTPLWGHERWGFQITPKGPRLFLQDALDPRCREAF